MYCVENFKTKKALKEAVKRGDTVSVYQPGPFGGDTSKLNGQFPLEGPHYPKPHTWYATAVLEDGLVVKVS